jgi:serine protease AprX
MQSDPTQYTDTQYDVFTIGAGYMDLTAALANISNAPATGLALSPVAFVDPTSGQVYASGNYAALCAASESSSTGVLAGSDLCSSSVGNAASIWQFDNQSNASTSTVAGTKCLWGAASVWGAAAFTSSSSTVSGSKCLWGAQSVWSASATEAFKCLWGAASVWGASSNGATSTDAASNVIVSGDNN